MFRTFLATVACLLTAGAVVSQSAPPGPAAEGRKEWPGATLTAGFLFNLARFTEWPAETAAKRITLCVLGDPAVAGTLDRLTGDRQITGRDVSVALLVSDRPLPECQLLYVAGTDSVSQARALEHVARLPVLTIGHGEHFVRLGGIVGLFAEAGRKRVVINTDAMARAKLTLSSRLLGLAKLVRDGNGQS